jgi:aquaporin Z
MSKGTNQPGLMYLAEFIGTAALVLVGLSVVIFMTGAGSPVRQWIPSAATRRLITGFLFGSTGATIAISWVGQQSGAHINPLVSLAFCLAGRLKRVDLLGYVVAQMLGAIAGALPLLLWGKMGSSVLFGATVPDAHWGIWPALLGEAATTLVLILLLFNFLGHQRLTPFTPLIFPPLYSIMVWLEAPLSGTSTNTARTLGPAVISGAWDGWWIYWIGPAAGTLIALAIYYSPLMRKVDVCIAKLYHFNLDPIGRLMAKAKPDHPCSGPSISTEPAA